MMSSKFSGVVLVVAIAVCLPAMVQAATITVNDLNDNDTAGDGNCTLREAINNANSDNDTTSGDCTAGSGADTIAFIVSGTITLSSELPPASGFDALTIDGTGQNIVISGNDSVRIISVGLDPTLHVKKLTLANGNAGTSQNGGAIKAEGTLTVENSIFSSNSAGVGGAISGINIIVTSCTFVGNTASNGGAIISDGTLTVNNSTFTGNIAFFGGAIDNEQPSGTADITNSTFYGNGGSEVVAGGAIYTGSGTTLTVINSTFSSNGAGGAFFGFGGAIQNESGTLNLLNTIIADSTNGPDCVNVGTLGTNENNLIEDGSCSPAFSGDPKLQDLNNNGGSTETMALDSDSPAIDAGDNATCAAAPVNNLDQRGFVRPIDGSGDSVAVCDIGAYEFGSSLPPAEAVIDIQLCENPNNFNCRRKGSLPVTIFGTADLDVSEINLSTLQLCLANDRDECVSLVDATFPEDHGNPETDLGAARCGRRNRDGFDDINALFSATAIATLIECSTIGQGNASPTLIIKGELTDGTQFQSTPVDDIGIDQLLIVK